MFINPNDRQKIFIKSRQKEAGVTITEVEPRTNGLFEVIG